MPWTQANQSFGTGSQYDQRTGNQGPAPQGTLQANGQPTAWLSAGYGPQYNDALRIYQAGQQPSWQQTGTVSYPGAAATGVGMGAPQPQPANPYQIGAQFAQMTGGQPTNQILSQMQAGTYAPPGAAAPAGAGQTKPLRPPQTPASASQQNAGAPGSLNGNTESGIPASESGFRPQQPQGGGMSVQGGFSQPGYVWNQQQGRFVPPTPGGNGPNTHPELPGQQKAMASPLATYQGMAETNAPGQTNEPTAPPAAGATAQSVLSPLQEQSKTWQQHLSTWWPQLHVKLPDAPLAGVPHISGDANSTNVAQVIAAIPDRNLARLAGQAWNLVYGSNSPIAVSLQQGSGSTLPVNPSKLERTIARARQVEEILKAYGIDFSPLTDSGFLGQPPVTDPNAPDDGTTPGDEAVDDGQLGGPSGGPSNNYAGYPGSNLEVSTLRDNQAGAISTVQGWKNQFGKDPTLIEAAQNQAAAATAEANKQKGVNIFGDAYNSYKNDPLRTQSLAMAQDILNNPDPQNWDLARSKLAERSNAKFGGDMQNLSDSFARRGVEAAGGAGLTGELYGQQANQLASGLGDLDLQQSQALREGQQNALNTAGSMFQLYQGGDLTAAHQLANMVAGAPEASVNPAQGWAQAQYSNNAYQEQANQGEPGFDWANLALQAAGSYFGVDLSGGTSQQGGGAMTPSQGRDTTKSYMMGAGY